MKKKGIKKRLTPKLRFPEFKDAKEWEIKQLGELLLDHPDYGVNAPAVSYSKKLPTYLRITDLPDDGYKLGDEKVSVSVGVTDDRYLNEGDIVLARTGASVGKSYRYKKEDGQLVFAGYLIRIRPDSQKINSEFLFNFISTTQYLKWVRATSARSGQPGINGNEYASLQIPVPPYKKSKGILSEQQKIADCLSFIDELIVAQTQKLEALKEHKKGLMQLLFPAEGETIPKLRFSEFRSATDWKRQELGKLSQILRGGSPRPIENFLTTDPNGLNWLKIGDVDKNSKYVTCTQEKVRLDALNKTREVYPGDLILSNSMSFGRPYILKIKSCIHDGWIAVTRIDGQITKDYLYYLMMSSVSQAYFLDNAAGSGVQNLNADIIKLLPVPFPKLPEQQKIADCLSSIDELIALQSQKLELLKEHKKGLMQQLFPNMDEVME